MCSITRSPPPHTPSKYLNRLAATHTAIRCIQKHWRGALQRKRLGTATAAAVRVQAAWRGHRTRAVLAKQQAAACTIQAVWRGVRVRREVARQRAAVVVIQRYAVGFIKRIRYVVVWNMSIE